MTSYSSRFRSRWSIGLAALGWSLVVGVALATPQEPSPPAQPSEETPAETAEAAVDEAAEQETAASPVRAASGPWQVGETPPLIPTSARIPTSLAPPLPPSISGPEIAAGAVLDLCAARRRGEAYTLLMQHVGFFDQVLDAGIQQVETGSGNIFPMVAAAELCVRGSGPGSAPRARGAVRAWLAKQQKGLGVKEFGSGLYGRWQLAATWWMMEEAKRRKLDDIAKEARRVTRAYVMALALASGPREGTVPAYVAWPANRFPTSWAALRSDPSRPTNTGLSYLLLRGMGFDIPLPPELQGWESWAARVGARSSRLFNRRESEYLWRAVQGESRALTVILTLLAREGWTWRERVHIQRWTSGAVATWQEGSSSISTPPLMGLIWRPEGRVDMLALHPATMRVTGGRRLGEVTARSQDGHLVAIANGAILHEDPPPGVKAVAGEPIRIGGTLEKRIPLPEEEPYWEAVLGPWGLRVTRQRR